MLMFYDNTQEAEDMKSTNIINIISFLKKNIHYVWLTIIHKYIIFISANQFKHKTQALLHRPQQLILKHP